MPFLSDVFAVVIVMTVYAPFQRSLCVCEPWVRKMVFKIYFVVTSTNVHATI